MREHGQKALSSTDCHHHYRRRRLCHCLHRHSNQYMSDEFGVVVVAVADVDGGGVGGTKAMDMTRA